MRILDRYVLKSFFAMFAGALVALSFLFTVISVLDSLNYLVATKGASLHSILKFYLLQLPQTVYMGSPLAALLSAMIVLGEMNQKHELMAMRAAGFSLARTAAPILAASVTIGLFTFAIGNTLVPIGNRQFLSARQEIRGEETSPGERLWYVSEAKGKSPEILRIEKIERKTARIKGLTIFETGKGFQLTREVLAKSASFNNDQGWQANDVTMREFTGDVPRTSKHQSLDVDIQASAQELLKVQRDPEEMTLEQLRRQMKKIHRYALPDAALRVELHTRFAIPVATLILVMVGIPLAIRPVRSGGIALPILAAVVIGFGYFVVIALMVSLGKGGMVSPWISAWAANIIFGGIGVVLFSRIRK